VLAFNFLGDGLRDWLDPRALQARMHGGGWTGYPSRVPREGYRVFGIGRG